MFETIIFFAAMGGQGNGPALAGGIAVAVAAARAHRLGDAAALSAQAADRASSSLIRRALIAVLAVVLAGKGLAALQEAGMIGVTPLAGFPRSPLLGVYPTLETLLAQGAMIALLAAGFLYDPPQGAGCRLALGAGLAYAGQAILGRIRWRA